MGRLDLDLLRRRMSSSLISLSSHVLDTTAGTPAGNLAVVLESFVDETYTEIARATTDDDGRGKEWGVELPTGVYRVTFATGAYFRAQDKPCFYPVVTIVFDAANPRTLPRPLHPLHTRI